MLQQKRQSTLLLQQSQSSLQATNDNNQNIRNMKHLIDKFNNLFSDSVMVAPLTLDIGGRRFDFYPQSLTALGATRNIMSEIKFDAADLTDYARVCVNFPHEVCRILALYSAKGRDICDTSLVNERTSYLEKNLTGENLVPVFMAVMEQQTLATKTAISNGGGRAKCEQTNLLNEAGVSPDEAITEWSMAKMLVILGWYNNRKEC